MAQRDEVRCAPRISFRDRACFRVFHESIAEPLNHYGSRIDEFYQVSDTENLIFEICSENDLECGSKLPPLIGEACFALNQGIRLNGGSKLPRTKAQASLRTPKLIDMSI
jgi:hypothetical protein